MAAQQQVRIPSMFLPHFTLEWEERPGREEQKSPQSQRVGGRTGERGLLTPEWAGPVASVWWLKWGHFLAMDRLLCVCPCIGSAPVSMLPHCVPLSAYASFPLSTGGWPSGGFSRKSFHLFHQAKWKMVLLGMWPYS